jgi:hypothetical protein
MNAEQIAKELGLDYSKIFNIYPYGSVVYGNETKESDHDYIIVFKSALLPSGAFRDNAISNDTYTIQAVCYSRTGFIDAINNYEIGALECLFLPEDKIIQKKWPFKIQKFENKVMAKKIIQKISDSWFSARQACIDGETEYAKKGVFHALRILHFALQLKENQKIVDYSCCNELKKTIMVDDEFKAKDYIDQRDKLMSELKA